MTFDGSPTGALVVNNLEWTGPLTVLDFLRDVGKHFSVNVMLSEETVSRRLAAGACRTPSSATCCCRARTTCTCTGGTAAGCRSAAPISGATSRRGRAGAPGRGRHVHALTTPLVTDAEGRKFGKSVGGGNLWLDPEMTSPYAWYQYFVNVADADVGRYLRLFTFLSEEEIEELEKAVAERPQARAAQRARRGADDAGPRAAPDRQVVAASQGAVRARRPARARRRDPGRGARRGADGRARRGAADDRRPARRQRPLARAGRAADGRRGRGLREQRQDRRRAVDADGNRPAPRRLARAAPRQADPRG